MRYISPKVLESVHNKGNQILSTYSMEALGTLITQGPIRNSRYQVPNRVLRLQEDSSSLRLLEPPQRFEWSQVLIYIKSLGAQAILRSMCPGRIWRSRPLCVKPLMESHWEEGRKSTQKKQDTLDKANSWDLLRKCRTFRCFIGFKSKSSVLGS